MPKVPTLPNLYDNALQINITLLKKQGYLVSNRITSGGLTWYRNGIANDSILITVNTLVHKQYIELNYEYNKIPRKYEVQIVSAPSNLNKGEVWYFICPKTQKRCRKLYSIDGYFLHREAFTGCMYASQTVSKKYRELEKQYGAYFNSDKLYTQLHKKYFKQTYRGKFTKRYLKIKNELEKANQHSLQEIEALYYL